MSAPENQAEQGLRRMWERLQKRRELEPGESRCGRCKLPAARDLVDRGGVCFWCRMVKT